MIIKTAYGVSNVLHLSLQVATDLPCCRGRCYWVIYNTIKLYPEWFNLESHYFEIWSCTFFAQNGELPHKWLSSQTGSIKVLAFPIDNLLGRAKLVQMMHFTGPTVPGKSAHFWNTHNSPSAFYHTNAVCLITGYELVGERGAETSPFVSRKCYLSFSTLPLSSR